MVFTVCGCNNWTIYWNCTTNAIRNKQAKAKKIMRTQYEYQFECILNWWVLFNSLEPIIKSHTFYIGLNLSFSLLFGQHKNQVAYKFSRLFSTLSPHENDVAIYAPTIFTNQAPKKLFLLLLLLLFLLYVCYTSHTSPNKCGKNAFKTFVNHKWKYCGYLGGIKQTIISWDVISDKVDASICLIVCVCRSVEDVECKLNWQHEQITQDEIHLP